MRPIRNCTSGNLETGITRCQPDWDKIRAIIIVAHGHKLPEVLTLEKLEELAHADRPERIYVITDITEFNKNGGEVQVSDNGYGGPQCTGVSARTDELTLDKFHPELQAALTRSTARKWDVYYVGDEGHIYGLDDGTDTLAGFPMAVVYADSTPHPTSGAQASTVVKCAFKDPKKAFTDFNFIKVDFDMTNGAAILGLTPVILAKTEGNGYKLIEKMGNYDCTADLGPALAAGASCFDNVTAVTYNEADETLTLTVTTGKTPSLKSPKNLYAEGVKGIVGV